MLLLDTNWGWQGVFIYTFLLPWQCQMPVLWHGHSLDSYSILLSFHIFIMHTFHTFVLPTFPCFYRSAPLLMLWQCMDLTLCCCSINSYCCKLLHVIKFPNFHTSIFHISPAVHIFISPPFCCSDNAAPRACALAEWSFAIDFTNYPLWVRFSTPLCGFLYQLFASDGYS